MRVRPAEPDELASVLGLIEGAMLEVDAEAVAGVLAGSVGGSVLVATAGEGTIVGAVVVQRHTVEAIAVRPRRRNQGIGSALIEAAADRTAKPLVAECGPSVRPFYEQLGFELTRIDDTRYRGRRPASTG